MIDDYIRLFSVSVITNTVATARENGLWMFIFPNRQNTVNLPKIFHKEFASNIG